MDIPFLDNLWRVEDDAVADFPKAALRDEALPNVTHSEGAVARHVHERKSLREPPCRLCIEWAPDMWTEADGWRVVKIKGTVFRKSPDGVYIRR